MSTIDRPPAKPEDEELAKKHQELVQLESELADGELQVATLRAELAEFERLYLRTQTQHVRILARDTSAERRRDLWPRPRDRGRRTSYSVVGSWCQSTDQSSLTA
jgi:hypothetical protein